MKLKLASLAAVIAAGLTIGILFAPGRSNAQVTNTGLLALEEPAAAQPAASGTTSPAESPIEYAMRFRQNAGLDATRATAEAREADPAAIRDFGIPLTPDENEMVLALDMRISDRGVEIQEAAATDPGFAGLWLERSEGFSLHVSTTSSPDVPLKALAQVVPEGHGIHVHIAVYTYAELRALQSKIEADISSMGARGVTFSSVGVDVKRNRVVLTFVDPEGTADLGWVTDQYGDMVVPERTAAGFKTLACTSRFNCPAPIKAGLAISRSGGTGTSAFVSRDTPYPGAVYLLTCGHCVGTLGESWTHNGLAIGASSSKFFSNGGSMDVGYILLSAVASPGNKLFVSTPTNIRNVTSWHWNGEQPVGSTVCMSGATSGYRCDGITETDKTIGASGTTLHNMWLASISAAGGDSGSPIFIGETARGVLSSGGGGIIAYTPLGTVYTQTGKQVCISSGC